MQAWGYLEGRTFWQPRHAGGKQQVFPLRTVSDTWWRHSQRRSFLSKLNLSLNANAAGEQRYENDGHGKLKRNKDIFSRSKKLNQIKFAITVLQSTVYLNIMHIKLFKNFTFVSIYLGERDQVYFSLYVNFDSTSCSKKTPLNRRANDWGCSQVVGRSHPELAPCLPLLFHLPSAIWPEIYAQ